MGESKSPQSDLPQETPKGRRICAWCKKDLGPAETEKNSHGICEECLAKVSEEIEPNK